MSPPTTTTSPSPKLDPRNFKGDTHTGDPPSPTSMQESVQMLTREDVAVKLMDELEKEKSGEDSEVWRDREQAVNGRGDGRVNEEEAQEEDQVDGLLSPAGEISMVERQDDFTTDSTARHDTTSQREDLTEEGQEVVSTPLISDDKADDPSSIPNPHNHASISPTTSTSPIPPRAAPPRRYPIPNRRPKGWISSLNHPRAVSSLSNKDITLTPPRSSSTSDLPRARISSVHVHQQPSILGGRRISGAMQYAFQRQSQTQTRGSSYETQVFEGEGDQAQEGEALEREEDPEEVIGLEQEQLSPEEEARIRYEVGLSQDQDEIWMEYVRNQLSSLFPDFFGANPAQLGMQMGESSFQRPGPNDVNDEFDEGPEEVEVERRGSPLYDIHPNQVPDDSASQANDNHIDNVPDIDSPIAQRRSSAVHPHNLFSTPNDRSFTTTSSTFSSLPTPPLGSNAEMLRGNVVIPNVRDEISGLREEIERLRSVVGGLAQELGGGGERGGGARIEEEGGVEGLDTRGMGVGEEEEGVGGEEREGEVEGTGMVEQEGDGSIIHQEGNVSSEDQNKKDEVDSAKESNEHEIESKLVGKVNDELLSEAFLKTAHLSANIIRLLDNKVNKKKLADVSDDKIKARSDEEIFSEANLKKIEAYIKNLEGK